jgi:hypothetical protein
MSLKAGNGSRPYPVRVSRALVGTRIQRITAPVQRIRPIGVRDAETRVRSGFPVYQREAGNGARTRDPQLGKLRQFRTAKRL